MQYENEYGTSWFSLLKGAGVALAVSFLGVILFAAILSTCTIPDGAIYPVNQTIKGLALAVGVLCFVKGEKGWAQGLAIAGIFTALSYVTFAVIGGDFSLSWWILLEVVFSLLIGGICGVVAVNITRK